MERKRLSSLGSSIFILLATVFAAFPILSFRSGFIYPDFVSQAYHINIGKYRLLLVGIFLIFAMMIVVFAKRSPRFLLIPVGLVTLLQVIGRIIVPHVFTLYDGFLYGVLIQGFFYLLVAVMFALTVTRLIKSPTPLLICLGLIAGALVIIRLLDITGIYHFAASEFSIAEAKQKIYYTAETAAYFISVGFLAVVIKNHFAGSSPAKLFVSQKMSILFASLYAFLICSSISVSLVDVNLEYIFYSRSWIDFGFILLYVLGGYLMILFTSALHKNKWFLTLPLAYSMISYIIVDYGYMEGHTLAFFCFLCILFIAAFLTSCSVFKTTVPLLISCFIVIAFALALQIIAFSEFQWGPFVRLIERLSNTGYFGPSYVYPSINITAFLRITAYSLSIAFAALALRRLLKRQEPAESPLQKPAD